MTSRGQTRRRVLPQRLVRLGVLGHSRGSKTFFPDVPLNSGFYRVVKAHLPEGSVVNAPWPYAVTGFCSGAYEKIMNATFELWSKVLQSARSPARSTWNTSSSAAGTAGGLRPPVHVVRLDGRRLGRPQRQGWEHGDGAGLRCRADDPAIGRTGAADPGSDHSPPFCATPAAREIPRRLRGGQGRHPHPERAIGDVLLLRPRALGHLRY